MFSKVGQDDYSGIVALAGIIIIIVLIIYAAYFVAIIGGIAGGGLSVYNYALSFKKNIIDENFSTAQ